MTDDDQMRARLAAFGIAVTCAVAACSSNKPDPKPTPTSRVSTVRQTPTSSGSSSAPTTASQHPSKSPHSSRSGPLTTGPIVRPAEMPPVMPPTARRHSREGAVAFTEYFFKALDWSIATNDAYLLTVVSARSCRTCQREIDGAKHLKASGSKQVSGRFTIVSISRASGHFDIRANYAFHVVTRDDPIVTQKPGSPPSTVAPATPRDASFAFVNWTNRKWTMTEIELAE